MRHTWVVLSAGMRRSWSRRRTVRRECGISRTTGYKVFNRYKEQGLLAPSVTELSFPGMDTPIRKGRHVSGRLPSRAWRARYRSTGIQRYPLSGTPLCVRCPTQGVALKELLCLTCFTPTLRRGSLVRAAEGLYTESAGAWSTASSASLRRSVGTGAIATADGRATSGACLLLLSLMAPNERIDAEAPEAGGAVIGRVFARGLGWPCQARGCAWPGGFAAVPQTRGASLAKPGIQWTRLLLSMA